MPHDPSNEKNSDEIALRALAIAKRLWRAEPGEKAAARRMDDRGAPIFWELATDPCHSLSVREELVWLRFTRAVALLVPSSKRLFVASQDLDDEDSEESEDAVESNAKKRQPWLHHDKRPFGAVLADGGEASVRLEKPFLSEQRFARLLATRGEARLEALERTVRMLARQSPRLNVVDLAYAFLFDNDKTSRRLARDYYARLDKSSPKDAKND